MPATEFAWGDAQAVQKWSPKIAREIIDKCYFKKFLGTSEDSILQMYMDLSKGGGDTIYHDVLYQNRGDGTQGDTTLEGNEEALELYQDTLKIDQLRQAHNFRQMSQQRTIHDLRKLGKSSLSTWFAWKFDTMMFAYLAGAVGDSSETASGTLGSAGFAANALQVPDAAHVHRPNAAMTLSVIDAAVTLAKTVNPRIRPVMVNGSAKYVAVLHPNSIYALRQASGAGSWREIHMNVAENGSKNPIYTGAMGEYNGVVIHESEYIPINSGTTVLTGFTAQNDTANLLLGAQAGAFALGNGAQRGENYFSWEEQTRDYGNNRGVAAGCKFGMKKTRFNSADFGVMQMQTTDAPPS